MKIPFYFYTFIFLLFTLSLTAQVLNDNMEDALFLHYDQAHSSKTDGCTVEWSCVDESLTGKCIDYHNDQWFLFNSESNSKLYINISNQNCRDLRGVQIVVLKGNPCQTNTYEVLTCVSLANQNDIYVELDSLNLGQNYYINIDGYLHDFCSFEIEVSQKSRGLPAEPSLDIASSATREEHTIQISWVFPDSLRHQVNGFELYKRSDKEYKVRFVGDVPVISNAYGEIQEEYLFKDSIPPNTKYYYSLAARQPDSKLLLIDQYEFIYRYTPKTARFIRNIRIPLENVKHKESITVIIYDFTSGKMIKNEVFTYHRKDPAFVDYNTHYAIQNRMDKLLVKVINNTTKITKDYTYDLWSD